MWRKIGPPPRGLAVTVTCKQIRAESTPFSYAENDFWFVDDMVDDDEFLATIGKTNTRATRSVTVARLAEVYFKLDT